MKSRRQQHIVRSDSIPELTSAGVGRRMTDHSEVRLLERIGRGNSQAFEELYQLYAGPLFSYARKSLATREDAEESLQDTFVKIWDRAHTYDEKLAAPFTWTMMILRGICMDKHRRLNAKRRGKSVELTAAPEPRVSAERTLESLHFAETAAQVSRALESLSQCDRECLELAVFGQISQEKIANQLNAPLGTVKTRIRRSLQKIRTLLKSHDA